MNSTPRRRSKRTCRVKARKEKEIGRIKLPEDTSEEEKVDVNFFLNYKFFIEL